MRYPGRTGRAIGDYEHKVAAPSALSAHTSHMAAPSDDLVGAADEVTSESNSMTVVTSSLIGRKCCRAPVALSGDSHLQFDVHSAHSAERRA